MANINARNPEPVLETLRDRIQSAIDNSPFGNLLNNDSDEATTTDEPQARETSTSVRRSQAASTTKEEDEVYTPPPREDRPTGELTFEAIPSSTKVTPTARSSSSQQIIWFPQETETTDPDDEIETQPSSSKSRIDAPDATSIPTDLSNSILTDGPSTMSTATRPRLSTSETSTTSPTSDADSAAAQTDSGMSSGGKAGLAIGIILIIALVAGAIFFLVRRKKQNDEHKRLDDEKHDLARSFSNNGNVNPSAPRLSLRPLTQLFSGMSGSQEKHEASTMIANSAAAAAAPRVRTPDMRQTPNNANPFGDDATEKAGLAVPVAAAAANSTAPKANSDRSNSGLSDGSPDNQAFPAAVAGSRRNSPPGPGPNNVYRVQLDFKPSMEDELELRAGSLVRLLHEYDDGWALCIRLDRSQQGVVPRTCISKAPVKPRPGPPPAGMRGPQGGRPRAPPGPGPRQGPYPNPHHGPGPRPNGPPGANRFRSQSNSPHQTRPQSPVFQGMPQAHRPRANSDAMATRQSPPSNSSSPLTQDGFAAPPPQAAMPVRKPVPGMAM